MLASQALIPIRDENPTKSFPLVTLLLIAINVFVFLFVEPNFGSQRHCGGAAQCEIQNCSVSRFFFKWGVVPAEITRGEQLAGEVCRGIPLEPKSVFGSLVTAMFVHGGFLHLGGNMLFLWVFGNNIEDRLGPVRFLIFYLLSGLAASMAHILANPASTAPTVGASGAIAGVLGAYIVLFPRARVHSVIPIPFLIFFLGTIRLPAAAVLGFWFVSQFFIGSGQMPSGGGVAWMAHVGGFVAGMVLILLFRGWRRRPAAPTPALG